MVNLLVNIPLYKVISEFGPRNGTPGGPRRLVRGPSCCRCESLRARILQDLEVELGWGGGGLIQELKT